MSSKMGRPQKLKENRAIYSIYINESTIKAIDEYVFHMKQESPGYSRSDFLNEAAEHYLKAQAKREKKHGKDGERQQN